VVPGSSVSHQFLRRCLCAWAIARRVGRFVAVPCLTVADRLWSRRWGRGPSPVYPEHGRVICKNRKEKHRRQSLTGAQPAPPFRRAPWTGSFTLRLSV